MDYKYHASFLLRSYAWAVIKANTDLSEADYGGLVPIVPLGEEPELTQFDKPYIIYGYAETNNPDDARASGNMAFVVRGTRYAEITNVITILNKAFERADQSAKDVNEYTSTIPSFVGLRFGTIEKAFVEGGTPEKTEGGRQSATLNITYEYYVNYDVTTSLAAWNYSQQRYVRTAV